MLLAKRDTQKPPKNVAEVSRFNKETSDDMPGAVVAACEVPPQDAAIMSLGVLKEGQPPKKFLIQYYPEVDESHIKTKITAHDTYIGGQHYLLQIANFSGATLCAEVREA